MVVVEVYLPIIIRTTRAGVASIVALVRKINVCGLTG